MRAYARDFWPSLAAYVVVLAAVLIWGRLDGTNPWRYAAALLPVLPALGLVRAVVRHVGRVDDYQRFLLLRSLAVGFAVAMVASITLGFLSIAGLAVEATGWIIYGVGMLGWIVGGALGRVR